MGGTSTAGYTKNAQKQKFVRNRDIKMKDKEIKKEQHIKKSMCENVCDRCREKLLWRFQYDKYKPLKNPGNCQDCRQKSITKAYRSLCDPCAKKRDVCAGCCIKVVKKDEGTKEVVDDSATEMMDEEEQEDNEDMQEEHEDNTEMMDGTNSKLSGDNSSSNAKQADDTLTIPENVSLTSDTNFSTIKWDERKFHTIAANKYSKARGVGEEDQTEYN